MRAFSVLRRGVLAALGASLMSLALFGSVTTAQALTEQELTVSKAQATVQDLYLNPNFPQIRRYVDAAVAVVIVPELIRGGFFVGGEGGNAVVLRRRPDGGWSAPAFFDLAAGSVGLQFGGQVSQMILTVMTEQGLDALLNRRVTLGGDLSVAVVTEGIGADIRSGLDLNADMYAFQENQGLFIGGALEGSILYEDVDDNAAYYGAGATAQAIFAGRYVNAQADGLRRSLGQ